MQSELLSAVLSVIVTAVTLVLIGYIIPSIKQRLGDDKLAEIKRLITIAVKYAEQVFTPEQFAEKKKAVYGYIVDKAKDAGLTEEEVDMLIESVVYEVKRDKKG